MYDLPPRYDFDPPPEEYPFPSETDGWKCESDNHTVADCHGDVWVCVGCHGTYCQAEGADDGHPELCDDCWYEEEEP